MWLRRPGGRGIVPGMATTPPITSRPHALASSPPGGVRVPLTRDQVLTAREVAELLHLPVSTVYHLARDGQLPATRLGRTWRFLRPRIEEQLYAN